MLKKKKECGMLFRNSTKWGIGKLISILTLPLTFTMKFQESIALSGPQFPTL